MDLEVESFLARCRQSSADAYNEFKKLLVLLESQDSKTNAQDFLRKIYKHYLENQPEEPNFHCFSQSVLNADDEQVELNLLQFPSTFMPEAWSYTFYEGLIRYPASEYQDRNIVELGCGIGWITIALALRYAPQEIYGVDINPKAVTCAKLNLHLNAVDSDGNPRKIRNNKSLLDIVKFQESNLFSYFNKTNSSFDKIIGCIPQVLNPEPEIMENLIAESSSDEYLYSLSNYFAKQGFIEDQFGLGLIASAVEQSIPLLKDNGKLILNLGGRPGRAVLERLMQRRGFNVRRVWQTQVEQAADTEIDALVDIEKTIGHRFEFYMSENSEISIDARTASAYAKAGGRIYHSVDVYEAELIFPEKVKQIFKAIESIDQDSIRSAIDLTFNNESDAEERFSFLAFLAKQLQKINNFPYDITAGLAYFRQQLAEYFRYYLRVDVTENQVMITPGRRELVTSLLNNFRPNKTIVAKSLCHLVDPTLNQDGEIIEAPEQVEFLTSLIEKLSPQLVITKLDKFELQSCQLVESLIKAAESHDVLLVIDLTDNIDLSSQPQIHGVYRYLSKHSISNNLVLMAGLMNNHVYQNYSLNITLSNNPYIGKSLIDSAELTYSRTPLMKQFYYAHLLEELLFFQRTRTVSVMDGKTVDIAASYPFELCDNAKVAFSHPAITGNHLAFDDNTVRLDFGENELPSPQYFNVALFESYLIRKCVGQEDAPEQAIFNQLRRRFNLPKHFASKVVLGNGVAPIYSAILNLCANEQRSLIIPSGSYGYFVAAAEYAQLKVVELKTEEENLFKISVDSLEIVLKENRGAWVFINAPVVNPTGAIYSSEELTSLFDIATKYDGTIVLDTIFSGLEFDQQTPFNFGESLEKTFHSKHAKLVILGGISKEYSAGGIRFGYAWSTALGLMDNLDELLVHKPHFTLKYAVRKLLEAHLAKDKGLTNHLTCQSEELSHRAKILTQVLTANGWDVLKPSGGLFLVAKPRAYILKHGCTEKDGGDRITDILFKEKNVAINNSTWTGLPGYCRFVLSCKKEDFEEAVIRLRDFNCSNY